MKGWKTLSEEELSNLTDEEIQQIENIICAEKGIEFTVKKPEQTVVELPKKDITVYEINGIGISGLKLTSLQETEALVNLLSTFKTIGVSTYKSGVECYEKGTAKDYNGKHMDISIQSELMVSEDSLETYIQNKKKAEEQQHSIDRYNTIQKQIQEAVKEFRQAYDNACEVIYNRQRYTSLFYDTYLPLAEGNEEIAMNFLKKAYNISRDDESYIKSIKPENYKSV